MVQRGVLCPQNTDHVELEKAQVTPAGPPCWAPPALAMEPSVRPEPDLSQVHARGHGTSPRQRRGPTSGKDGGEMAARKLPGLCVSACPFPLSAELSPGHYKLRLQPSRICSAVTSSRKSPLISLSPSSVFPELPSPLLLQAGPIQANCLSLPRAGKEATDGLLHRGCRSEAHSPLPRGPCACPPAIQAP